MKLSERCPSCDRVTSFIGANGCRAAVRDCRDPWHCRDPRHQALAHASDPEPALSKSSL